MPQLPQPIRRIIASPTIRRALARFASALMLLLGLWVALYALATMGAYSASGPMALPFLVLIGVLLWWINRLHRQWSTKLSAQRRQSASISKAMRKGIAVAEAHENWLADEQARAARISARPRWKVWLRRLALLTLMVVGGITIFILALSLGDSR